VNRPVSTKGTLVRLGFSDTDAATAQLDRLGPAAEPVLAMFGRVGDPDLALDSLVRLVEVAGAGVLGELVDDEGTAMRLLSVLGASRALGDHLVRHPEQWSELTDPLLGTTRPPAYWLRERLLAAVGADPYGATPVAGLPEGEALDALRVEYRRHLLRLAARDLAHDLDVADVAAELSDLAAASLEAALAVARSVVAEAEAVDLTVIAMGKCGGHELNYVSDVDVIFVHRARPGVDDGEAIRIAGQLGSTTMRVCSVHTSEGALWAVDAALRPEGKAGVLSRTLEGHLAYYERWASTWEFQAQLKARPVAGDLALGRAYVDQLAPLVWTAAERDGFVADTQAMRRRVVDHIPAREADRELKLGIGGLRDVEFAVQLLQLVHGRADTSIRDGATLSALAHLTEGGYVGREDGESLHRAYAFERTLEHRLQLWEMRRTHVVPRDPDALRRLGRSMGFLKEPVETLEQQWAEVRREVRRLHEKLFYRPLLSAVAQLPGADAHLSLEAAEERLEALGYADPAAALRHLEALSAGVSRSAAMQRTLLPAMLTWFAEGPDPDAGLFGFRRISEALRDTPWYLRALRDEGLIAERLAAVLSTSRYTTGLLEREPAGVRILGESLEPLTGESLQDEMALLASRRTTAEQAVRAIRAVRRRELFRISTGELLGVTDVAVVGAGLSRLADATIASSLTAVERAVQAQLGLDAAPTAMAVIAMGRYGGFELSYASDADVLFVHRPVPGVEAQMASRYAQAVAVELRRLLALPGADPAMPLDADLRPDGRKGALVRSLDAYDAYYRGSSAIWERQALLRADAVVGDESLRADFIAMVDPLRYPAGGIGEDDVREIRRIKGRVDAERLPRGADPSLHLKLGRGGLADIEWTVQLLQLRHAAAVPGLRTPRTLPALAAAADAGLIAEPDAETLATAWRQVSRVRNATTLARGKPSDSLPSSPVERRAVAAILGYPDGGAEQMVDDHLRLTRRAYAVVDRVFWG
jgi:[glutamine synthetase] adenylyltransferase / [glutamine synthetase]-adenylyl-L-tyrosine phosphorylase